METSSPDLLNSNISQGSISESVSSAMHLSPSLKRILVKELRKNKLYDEIYTLNRVKSIDEFNALSRFKGLEISIKQTSNLLEVKRINKTGERKKEKKIFIQFTNAKEFTQITKSEFANICGIKKNGFHSEITTDMLFERSQSYMPNVENYKLKKKSKDTRNIYYLAKPSSKLDSGNIEYDIKEKELYQKINIYLNLLQKQLFHNLPVFGYIEGKSYLDYLKVHTNSEMYIKFDIKNFYESIKYDALKDSLNQIIKYYGKDMKEKDKNIDPVMPNPVSNLLVNLSTINTDENSKSIKLESENNSTRFLAQGLEISPAISNLYLYEFDKKIEEWCKVNGLRYSRYCDDFIISSQYSENLSLETIVDYIKSELSNLSLELNQEKLTHNKKNQFFKISGIIIRDDLYLPDKYFKHMYNILVKISPRMSLKQKKFLMEEYYSVGYEKDNAKLAKIREIGTNKVNNEFIRMLHSIRGKIEYSIQVNKFQLQTIKLVKRFNSVASLKEYRKKEKVPMIKSHPVDCQVFIRYQTT